MKKPNDATTEIPAAAKKLMEQGVSQRKAINLAGLGEGPGGNPKKR